MFTKIKDKDLQQLIGNILRYGVYISLFFAIVGGIFFLTRYGQEPIGDRFQVFHEQDRSIWEIIQTVYHGVMVLDGKEIVGLGILILLVTPTVRVFCSLLGFILEKDILYIAITLIVLLVIGISIRGGIG